MQMNRVKLFPWSCTLEARQVRPYSSAQEREDRAATSFRPDWATRLAAAAVFSQRTTVISGCSCKKAEHWAMACSWEQISLMSDSLAPGLASRLWSTFSRRLRTMRKSWRIIRSYTALTEPAVLFSTGMTPYWHSPFSMAENTASKLEK